MKKNDISIKTKRIICAALISAFMLTTYGCGASYNTIAEDDHGTAASGGIAKSIGADGAAFAEGDHGGEEAFDGSAEYSTTMAMDMTAGADTRGGDAPGDAVRSTEDESSLKQLPEAGQLTAGQWNDNENWGFFSNLVNSGTISFPAYGIDPTNRLAVTVNGNDGKPIVNAKAHLMAKDGSVIWSGMTNKNGIVYLFNISASESASVEIEADGKKQSYEAPSAKSDEQNGSKKAVGSEMTVVFDGKGSLYKDMDVMFIVDTTGSMADELLFLQSEFTAITEKVGTDHTRYSVNFYRDEYDEYVTKCNPFSTDIKTIQKNLNNEIADGGGDYPEAVSDALTETMFASDWSEESVKLAFMIFDAPPHSGKEQELLAAAQEAAKKGIHIIPVISSDSDRDTELFGRAIAITTDGSYVFLTDDSGIGNSHEEPVIGSYEVRPLYDIIVDIIDGYRQ